MRIPIHVIGEYNQRKQAGFPSSHGKVPATYLGSFAVSQKGYMKSTEPSRRLYSTFLDSLKVSYKPDKIRG